MEQTKPFIPATEIIWDTLTISKRENDYTISGTSNGLGCSAKIVSREVGNFLCNMLMKS